MLVSRTLVMSSSCFWNIFIYLLSNLTLIEFSPFLKETLTFKVLVLCLRCIEYTVWRWKGWPWLSHMFCVGICASSLSTSSVCLWTECCLSHSILCHGEIIPLGKAKAKLMLFSVQKLNFTFSLLQTFFFSKPVISYSTIILRYSSLDNWSFCWFCSLLKLLRLLNIPHSKVL